MRSSWGSMTNQRRLRALTFRLNAQQRRKVSEQAKTAKNARSVRRAIALLELDQGRPVAEVAAMLGVTRQTLYNWRARLETDDVSRALRDRKGRGRRTAWTEPVRRFLDWSMALPPEELGYASVGWTAALLLRHMETWAGMRASDTTLREQLHRLGYVCHRQRRRVPLSAGSPVPRDPPGGAESVLRAPCRGPRAHVVKALAGGGAPECPSLSGEGDEAVRSARCGSLSRGRSALSAR
jgi:transposase